MTAYCKPVKPAMPARIRIAHKSADAYVMSALRTHPQGLPNEALVEILRGKVGEHTVRKRLCALGRAGLVMRLGPVRGVHSRVCLSEMLDVAFADYCAHYEEYWSALRAQHRAKAKAKRAAEIAARPPKPILSDGEKPFRKLVRPAVGARRPFTRAAPSVWEYAQRQGAA